MVQGRLPQRARRAFEVESSTEGCVANDELGYVYVGEEKGGIWKYGAEPKDDAGRMQVDHTGAGGQLAADVEGLAIVYGPGSTGYLIASSQSNNAYVVYRRNSDNPYVLTFAIASGSVANGVEDTNGIDVTNGYLGPAFLEGMFVAQDGKNDDGNHNFKLVPRQMIAPRRSHSSRANSDR